MLYLRIRKTSSPINNTTKSKKKNSNSLPSSKSPQLQKIITNRRKKNNKLSSEPPKKDIPIPPYSFCLFLSVTYILYFNIIICLLTIKVNECVYLFKVWQPILVYFKHFIYHILNFLQT